MLNSSVHLQNVIEDALDMSRMENNKFSIFIEAFDVRKIINEVSEIMAFPLGAKNLKMITCLSSSVPSLVETD